MSRTYVVTGSASGIGKETARLLTEQGHTVIGVDVRDADVVVDLTVPADRERIVREVTERSGGTIDAIVAVAGLGLPVPATVAVNYFGMIATLEDLRPLLAGSDAPRAAGVSSVASLLPADDELIDLMLAGDEAGALARAATLAETDEGGSLIYSSTKAAFARWIRRNATKPEWADAGIPLNAVAPGVFVTPMTAGNVGTEEGRKALWELCPMPLNGIGEPVVIGHVLVWLTSPENTHLCGQVVFADGGADVVHRGDSTW
ncbi:SDR family oxidoreductase [Salana multivorans]